MLSVAIHQPQYLPWLPYFDKADRADCFIFLDNVTFQPRGVQNRNRIKGANGPILLTVPVRGSQNTLIKDVLVANDTPWVEKHIRSIELNYKHAPHFSLLEELAEILRSHHTHLADLCIAVTRWLFEVLGIKCRIERASAIETSGAKGDRIIELCRAIGADTYVSGVGAGAYQSEEQFIAQGVRLIYQNYTSPVYPQCFEKTGFINDLSVLDVILNHGRESRQILLSGRHEQVLK